MHRGRSDRLGRVGRAAGTPAVCPQDHDRPAASLALTGGGPTATQCGFGCLESQRRIPRIPAKLAKPSSGLEPLTPALPFRADGCDGFRLAACPAECSRFRLRVAVGWGRRLTSRCIGLLSEEEISSASLSTWPSSLTT